MTAVLPRPAVADSTARTDSTGRSGFVSRLPRRSDRPAWIRIASAVIVLVAIVLGVVLAHAGGAARNGIDVIGNRTAPDVARADDLSYELADMDAQLANVLLAGNDQGQAAMRRSAQDEYNSDRAHAETDLQQATEVAGNETSVATPVHAVLDNLAQYEALAGEAMLLNGNEQNPVGRPSADVLALARQATDTMATALAGARSVVGTTADQGARAVLERAYTTTRDTTVGARRWLAILGVVLLGALIGLQVWLRFTVRRRINAGLAAATVVAAVVVIGGFVAMSTAAGHLAVAKKDAFDSLVVLRQAQATSSDANADESRYLVDPGRAPEYQNAFFTESQQLAAVRATDVFGYDSAFATAWSAYTGSRQVAFTGGLFAQELNNITFPGEQAAAAATLNDYQQYQLIDRKIRGYNQTGDLDSAITLDTGTGPGQSDAEFTRYTNDLNSLIGINQRAFDSAIAAGAGALGGWNGLLPFGGAAVIVVLVLVGVRPRLAEYR